MARPPPRGLVDLWAVDPTPGAASGGSPGVPTVRRMVESAGCWTWTSTPWPLSHPPTGCP